MGSTKFDSRYPTICRILAGTGFDRAKEAAEGLSPDDFKRALKESRLACHDLLDLLRGAIVPDWNDKNADWLECHLATIVDTLGEEKARKAFRDKLLKRRASGLEDLRYEVAVAAIACRVLDPGSVELEKSIIGRVSGTQVPPNSDVFGSFNGAGVRLEATVHHEKPLHPEKNLVQRVTPAYAKLDYPNPKRARDVMDQPNAPMDHPVSTKIRGMIEGKPRQCEEGLINIVVLGNPSHRDEDEVADALLGPIMGIVASPEDPNGNPVAGEGVIGRLPKAPFVPRENLTKEEDRKQFIDPFVTLSAVLQLRLGSDPAVRWFENPNAKVPVPDMLMKAILNSALKEDNRLTG